MDFIGNQKIVWRLNRAISTGSVSQAYIFSGPEYVGKSTLAKIFAQHVIAGKLSLEIDVDFKDKDALLDLVIVSPEIVEKKDVAKQRDIPIDKIRDMRQELSLFPYKGKFKVLVVEDAHRMNVSAQNALLKLLEEPNPTTIIILVTHEVDRILPTIQSRCQTFNFFLASDMEMCAAFSEEVVDLSLGRPGLASRIKEDTQEFEARSQARSQFFQMMSGSLGERFKIAEELSKDIMRTLDKLNVWIWMIRRKALSATEESERVRLYSLIAKMRESAELLKRTNANGRLVLETLLMDI